MPRKRVVTRTITGTVVTANVADLVDNTIKEISATLSGEYKNNDKLLRDMKKAYDSDTQKVLQITSTQQVTHKYGMSEIEFLANAEIMD